MSKVYTLILLLILAVAVAGTTSFVYPAPVPQPPSEKNIPAVISKDRQSSSSEETSEESSESVNDKERMLCNAIVRATHDLHVHQSKSADEIASYLNTDCETLGNEELIKQCREMVDQHSAKIYEHVANEMVLSRVCEKIEDGNELDLADERSDECSHEGGNKCQCCKMHVKRRKMRFRYIVKQMAKERMCMCQRSSRPHCCRRWIRREERLKLQKIEKICPRSICKHLGYCETLPKEGGSSEFQAKWKSIGSPSLPFELLDQRVQAHLTNDVCGDFKELQALCIHLAASSDSHRYAMIYMAVLQNDTNWLDNDLRNEVQSIHAGVDVDLCASCKNVIKSSKDFYLQALAAVRSAFNNTCEQCPARDKCEEFFNKRVYSIQAYLDSLNSGEFCLGANLCVSSSSAVVISASSTEECTACVQRLHPRKDAAMQAVDRLSTYFTDLCTKVDIPQCLQVVSEMVTEARSFINQFDVEGTCMAMGFCGLSAAHDMEDYERAFVEEIGKEVCPLLGPFEALCQQVVQGISKQVQTVSLNATSIHNLFTRCEEGADEVNDVAAKTDKCPEDMDKCQCCIDRVIQKKKCAKKRVAMYVSHMLHLCQRCPAREKCEHFWEDKKECWNAKINQVCPKKVCIRMGYCKKADTLSMCAHMGSFKQACETSFNAFEQLFKAQQEQPAAMPSRQMWVLLMSEGKKQLATIKP